MRQHGGCKSWGREGEKEGSSRNQNEPWRASVKSLVQGWWVMVKRIAWLLSMFCPVAKESQRKSNAQGTDIHFHASTNCKVWHQRPIRSVWKWGLRLPLLNGWMDSAFSSVWERHYFSCGRSEQFKAFLNILCIAAFILSWWCRPPDPNASHQSLPTLLVWQSASNTWIRSDENMQSVW